jgi:thiol:disulfide interchange protein DsbA
MDKLRRTCTTTLALGLLVSPAALMAATDHSADGPFGRLDPPVPTDASGKIEVIEFFWYGCPHCAKVEPFVEAWEKQLPPDVVFRREHIVWDGRPETQTHAQVFATLRAMDLVGSHQQAVFDAVHKERIDFRVHQAASDWAAKRGVDRARFDSMYKSFSVNTQIARMELLTSTYKIDGVPKFVINGKFVTEPHRAGGERQVFDVIDRLVAQERAAVKR